MEEPPRTIATQEPAEGISTVLELLKRLEVKIDDMASGLSSLKEGRVVGGTDDGTGENGKGDLGPVHCCSGQHEAVCHPAQWLESLKLREAFDHPVQTAPTQSARLSIKSYQEVESWNSRWMVNPNSHLLVVWHLLCSLVLLFDLTLIPYSLAWNKSYDDETFFFVGLVQVLFWTVDIAITFRTGFYNGAELVMDPGTVARRYLRAWFAVDVVLLACEILSNILSNDFRGRSTNLLRLARLGRILRVFRLLRLYRLVQLIEAGWNGGGYQLMGRFASITLQMASFNHLMTCAWYALGIYGPTDTGERWIDTLPAYSRHEAYEYLTAMHWSVAQFTLGATDVNCTNSVERVFNILFLVLGLIWSSTIIASLSAEATEYLQSQAKGLKKERQVIQFFKEKKVNPNVGRQVHHQVRNRLSQSEKIIYGDVEAFVDLPAPTKRDLKYEIYKDHLKSHALFQKWCQMDRGVAKMICDNACKHIVIMPNDELFVKGADAKGAYYLSGGCLRYKESPTLMSVQDKKSDRAEFELGKEEEAPVPALTWFCEAALWTHWTHIGTVWATREGQVLKMDGKVVGEELQHALPEMQQITMAYAEQFHLQLKAAQPPRRWPNDLHVPFTDYGTLVFGMKQDVREVIGRDAIRIAYGDNSSRRLVRGQGADSQGLEEHLKNGEKTIVLSSNKELEELAAVVCLLLENEEGNMLLVQVGRQDAAGKVEADCGLPSGKQRAEEGTEAVWDGMLAAELAFLKGKIEVKSVEREEEDVTGHEKWLRRAGLPKRRLRTVYRARLTEGSGIVPTRTAMCPLPSTRPQVVASSSPTRHRLGGFGGGLLRGCSCARRVRSMMARSPKADLPLLDFAPFAQGVGEARRYYVWVANDKERKALEEMPKSVIRLSIEACLSNTCEITRSV